MKTLPMFTQEEGLISRPEFLHQLLSFNFPTVHSRRSVEYYNIPAAFDIEVTSFYADGVKQAIMYHWQFGIWNMVTTGRTWEEFNELLIAVRVILGISEEKRLAVYVHNLPYEFQFIRKRFAWDKVFLIEDRKPVYARTNGIEFRCMMKLAGGRALSAVAKDLQKYKVEKMVGDLDYSVHRTPLTPLTEKELKYCENDIRICLSYIQEKIEQDGDITKIPLTNTGYVRKYCRKECFRRWKRYKEFISELTVVGPEYGQLKRGFQGGFVHANHSYVDILLNRVGSYDLISAYPSTMLLEQLPMSRATLVDRTLSESELVQYLTKYCCLFDLEVTNLSPKLNQDHPISGSKCSILEGELLDNGRVVYADRLRTTITEQDYFTYRLFYEWDTESISNLRIYEKGYLPKQLAIAVLDLYRRKTELKGVKGMELEYMIAKNMLNAAYGMMVTDIVRTEYDYVDDMFDKRKPNLDEALERYNKDIKRFLFYPWGVWITAYCRANLFSAIYACSNDYVYADTDSVKILNPETHKEYFENYNAEIIRKINKVSTLRGQDPSVYMPKNPKGKSCILGTWDFEGIFDEFKTLGAKRYLVREGDKYTLTVAGTNKVKSCEYLVSTGDPFGMFTNKLKIPAESSGKNILLYIDDPITGTLVDQNGVPYDYYELSSVHMEAGEYNLSLSEDFIRYLKGGIDFGE